MSICQYKRQGNKNTHQNMLDRSQGPSVSSPGSVTDYSLVELYLSYLQFPYGRNRPVEMTMLRVCEEQGRQSSQDRGEMNRELQGDLIKLGMGETGQPVFPAPEEDRGRG